MFKLSNKDPIILDKTEVKKEYDSDSEQFKYVKNNWFSNRWDKNGCILHAYRTRLVDAFEIYEDAKDKSISFKFNAREDTFLMHSESVSKRHLNLGEKNNVHTGMMIWTFSDDSSIVEIVSFTKKRNWFQSA